MPEVDLSPVKEAVAVLEEKYPAFKFETDFEPTISHTRGIFETRISRANKPDDAWTHIMIVPNSMASKESYQHQIEVFFRERFGIRD